MTGSIPISRLMAGALIAVAMTQISAGNASAAGYYEGKKIVLWIGGGVAGGVNLYGRTLGRHIIKHLPGGKAATVVPKNLPGAGGIGAVIALYTRARKDGTAFGTSAQGPITDPLLRNKKMSFDMLKFNWIGSLVSNIQACYIWSHLPYKSIQDAMTQSIKLASTGARSGGSKVPLSLNAAIGTKFKVIIGYRGSGGSFMAMERGEVAGRCASYSSLNATRPQWIEQGKINFLVQIGVKKHPKLPNVPLAMEFAKTESDRKLLEFTHSPLAISNAFALPPGVPQQRIKEWRAAWAATMKDPAFLAEAKKVRLELSPKNGDQVLAILKQIYATPKDVLKRAADAIARRNLAGKCDSKVSKNCRKKKKRKKKKQS